MIGKILHALHVIYYSPLFKNILNGDKMGSSSCDSGAVTVCLGSEANGKGSNPASLYFSFFLANFFEISEKLKYFCLIYSIGKDHSAAVSIATA